MKRVIWIMIFILLMSWMFISFAEDEIIELYVGESIPLNTKVVSGEVLKDESDIVWTYSEDGICSVSSSDIITGKKAGKVTVIGNLNKGGSILEVRFDVLVKNTVKKVEPTIPDQNLRVGESFTATYELIPVDLLSVPMNKGVKLKSTDSDILKVSSSGIVTAVSTGEAYVQIESTEAGKKAYIKVSIEPTVSKISIDQKMEKIYVGESKAMSVTYTAIEGKEIFLNESEWLSFDTNILKVNSEGIIEGIKAGKASLRAISKDNAKMSTVGIEVISGVQGIELANNSIAMSNEVKTYELKANIIPIDGLEQAYEEGVLWSSSNSSVCSVNSSGLLTAKKTGSATITAESKDGGYKAYASVKVSMPTTNEGDSKVEVKKITLNNQTATIDVGEKLLLDFEVEPANADLNSISFTIRTSGIGKIEKIDGAFYYTAFKDGVTYIDVKSDGNKHDSMTVFSESMLEGFEISEDNFIEEYGWKIIYLGQKIKLNPVFDMVKGEYPLLDDVTYSTSDSKIAKIVDGDYIQGLKIGEFSLKGVTKDNNLEDKFIAKVVSNIDSIETEASARIGIGMGYVPTVLFVPKENNAYELTEVLAKDITLSIDKIRISSEFIKKEIDYSKLRKAELEKLIDDESGDLQEHLDELQKCYHRLFLYETIYKSKSGKFCDIGDIDKPLTDRNYNDLKIAYINNNKLYANFVSKISLRVQTLDPDVHEVIDVSVEDNISSIVIFDQNGEIVTASVEKLLNHYTNEDLFANNPSSWAVDHIKLANTQGLLIDQVINDYQAYITREEFIELVMNFYDVSLGFPEVPLGVDIFDDTNNPLIIKAFELGIVSGKKPHEFAPMENVTREEMCVILSKTLNVMNKSLEKKKTYNNFSDEDSISSWAKDAVDQMTQDSNILSGVGGNNFSPRGNTTKEQAIIVIYKIFDSLE